MGSIRVFDKRCKSPARQTLSSPSEKIDQPTFFFFRKGVSIRYHQHHPSCCNLAAFYFMQPLLNKISSAIARIKSHVSHGVINVCEKEKNANILVVQVTLRLFNNGIEPLCCYACNCSSSRKKIFFLLPFTCAPSHKKERKTTTRKRQRSATVDCNVGQQRFVHPDRREEIHFWSSYRASGNRHR